MTDFVICWLLVSASCSSDEHFFKKKRQILLRGQPHLLHILCSGVRVKLLARAKVIFLREPDDFFFVGNPG